MKKLILIMLVSAGFALSPVGFIGCATHPPSQRVVEVQTLKAVGQSAEAAVTLSAQFYRDGRITAAQARQVIDFYDTKFQPAFKFARAAVNANLDSVASPEVLSLANQLSTLVMQLQTHTP